MDEKGIEHKIPGNIEITPDSIPGKAAHHAAMKCPLERCRHVVSVTAKTIARVKIAARHDMKHHLKNHA